MAFRRPNGKLTMILKYIEEGLVDANPQQARCLEDIRGIIQGKYSYKKVSAYQLVDGNGRPVAPAIQSRANPSATAHGIYPR